GQDLEVPALAQLERQLAPLRDGRRVQAQGAAAEEDGTDGAPRDRLQEVKGARRELEVEDVAVEDQPVHRCDPAVRTSAAQRGIGWVGRRGGATCAGAGDGRAG